MDTPDEGQKCKSCKMFKDLLEFDTDLRAKNKRAKTCLRCQEIKYGLSNPGSTYPRRRKRPSNEGDVAGSIPSGSSAGAVLPGVRGPDHPSTSARRSRTRQPALPQGPSTASPAVRACFPHLGRRASSPGSSSGSGSSSTGG